MTNLPDDVVERSADAMLAATGNKVKIRNCNDAVQKVWLTTARAALEAARYGELVEALRKIAYHPSATGPQRREFAHEVLSTIGEPNPDSGGV